MNTPREAFEGGKGAPYLQLTLGIIRYLESLSALVSAIKIPGTPTCLPPSPSPSPAAAALISRNDSHARFPMLVSISCSKLEPSVVSVREKMI